MRVILEREPAYILHVKPHLDKTRLVAALTADHGWLRLVARLSTRFIGVPVEPFMPVRLSCRGTGDMPGIRAYEVTGRAFLRDSRAQMLGLYLNELVMKLMAPHVPCRDLFDAYATSLEQIGARDADEKILRRFEVVALNASGHGLNLSHDTEGHDIDADAHYVYDPESGARLCDKSVKGAFSGGVLRNLNGDAGGADDAQSALEAKRFMRFMIDYHLQGREIRTRGLFRYLESDDGG